MNRPFLPAISDKSATGPAGRLGAAVVDVSEAGFVVVVGPDFPLLPLEHAERSAASRVHAMSTAGGTALRCIRLVVHRAAGYRREKVTEAG
jgi:hypothetical protein